jgi:hypothetical protein
MKRLRNWAEEKAAREERDRLIVELRAKGLRWKQIARVMNLTPWRVQCLHAKVARRARGQRSEVSGQKADAEFEDYVQDCRNGYGHLHREDGKS